MPEKCKCCLPWVSNRARIRVLHINPHVICSRFKLFGFFIHTAINQSRIFDITVVHSEQCSIRSASEASRNKSYNCRTDMEDHIKDGIGSNN